MCMQCMAAVATSGAAATGIRAWLATRGFSWLTPRRLKRATITLVVAFLVASSLIVSGSSGPATAAAGASPTPAANGSK